MIKKITINQIINKVLFFYILSIYLFTYREQYTILSNAIALVLIGLIWLNFLLKRDSFKFNYFLFIYILFIITCITSIFYAINQSASLIQSRTLVLLYILMVSLINYIDNEETVVAIMKYFALSGFIASIYIFLFSDFSQIIRFGTQLGNVNKVGLMLGISATFNLYFVLEKRKYIFLPFVMLNIITILLTGSRKSLLFISFSLFIMFISQTKNNMGKVLKNIFLGIITIIILFYIVYKVPVFYRIIGRRMDNLVYFIFNKCTTESSINQRYHMMIVGYDLFKDKPLTGYGLSNYRYLFANVPGGHETYAHNNIIELLVGVGIFGTILFYFAQIIVLKDLFKASKSMSNNLCYPFIVIISGYILMSIGSIYYYNKNVSIILAIGSIIYNLSKSKEKDKHIIKV